MSNYINKIVQDNLFKDHAIKVQVFLPGAVEYGDYYDPKRDEELPSRCTQNPICVKALSETLTGSSLIFRQFGLAETGAIRLTVKTCDAELFKIAKAIKIDGKNYYAYHDACGNRFQIFPLKFGYSKVILFQKGN